MNAFQLLIFLLTTYLTCANLWITKRIYEKVGFDELTLDGCTESLKSSLIGAAIRCSRDDCYGIRQRKNTEIYEPCTSAKSDANTAITEYMWLEESNRVKLENWQEPTTVAETTTDLVTTMAHTETTVTTG